MVDEASVNHTPISVIKGIAIFVLIFIISSTAMSVAVSVPLVIYLFADGDIISISSDYISGAINDTEYMEQMMGIVSHIPSWMLLINLFAYALMIAVCVFYCIKFEKRPLSSMGLRKRNAPLEYLVGLGIGAVMFFLVLLIPCLTGMVKLTLNPEGFMPVILLYFVAFVIQGASEELLVRGYFMVSLARDTRASVAVVISSVAFGLLHLGNTGVSILSMINIILFGIILGIYVFKRGNLWGACAIHTAWNFLQGNIFGASVSGMSALPSVFVMEVNSSNALLTGGDFGFEGSILCTLVLLITLLLTALLKQNSEEITEARVEYFE